MRNIINIIFDADDTLWENNVFFVQTTEKILELISQKGFEKEYVETTFLKIEKKIVNELGYGTKNYILIVKQLLNYFEKTHRLKIDIHTFDRIINQFYQHKRERPKLFAGTIAILDYLYKSYNLFVLTKGQLEEQEEKILRSGLQKYFKKYFILPEKDDSVYSNLISKEKFVAAQTVMIGNSPKSDINPALRAGMFAIFIPYEYTWNMDNEDLLIDHPNLMVIEKIEDLKKIL